MKLRNIIGATVLILAVLASLPIGAARSFEKLRDKVEGEYYYDATGYSLWQGIDERETISRSMITLAEKYVDKNKELDPLIDNLEYTVKLSENYWFSDISGVDKKIEYNSRMGEAADALYKELSRTDLSSRDAKYPDMFMDDMKAEQDKLSRSSFNEKVDDYNRQVDDYPLGVVLKIAGVEHLKSFKSE